MLRYLRPNSSSAEMKCTKREQLATKSGRHDQGDQEEHDCITLEARRQLDRQYVHLHFPIKRRLGARLHEDRIIIHVYTLMSEERRCDKYSYVSPVKNS